jgi:hypothetical protein
LAIACEIWFRRIVSSTFEIVVAIEWFIELIDCESVCSRTECTVEWIIYLCYKWIDDFDWDYRSSNPLTISTRAGLNEWMCTNVCSNWQWNRGNGYVLSSIFSFKRGGFSETITGIT